MEPYATLPQILVVDDDDRLRELLARFLTDNGFVVATAANGSDALSHLAVNRFDLMVLDIMMPGMTGMELARKLQEEGCHLPILMLTALSEMENKIEGLEAGVDDYLTKPFEPKELVLRIRAILRRARMKQEKPRQYVRFGEFVFDVEKQRLMQRDNLVHLTSQEADILAILARFQGRPVSREDIANATGGMNSERSIDVQINRLRKKIEPVEGRPQYILTSRGAGYVLQGDE